MATYKGIELDDGLAQVVRHMSSVEEYRETLQSLQGVWDNLTLLGQLSGTGTDMSATRQAFHQLTNGLLNNLGNETLKKTVMEMKSKAQVAVDIMIRNLFERTADIGFLATDDDIRDYAAKAPDYLARIRQGFGSEKERLQEELERMSARLQLRFREYVQKYSVYHNIILLDCDGNVLIQLDQTNPVERSDDPLIGESLHTSREYVETFQHSDLLPGEDSSLIYSYRVTSPEDGSPLGVLCLCFRFRNETAGIFANLREAEDWSVITLLDHEGRVIASSDEWHIPVGATMERVLDADYRVVRFNGREYLAATRPTNGYQGYTGLGWYGHVMVPLEHAFDKDASDCLKLVSAQMLEGVMSNPSLFSDGLRNIPLQADKIQRELNRSVWNGNVRQSSDRKALNPAFSKILLWEISNTGLKTKDVFERSIGNLHQTVVSTILQDSRFLASLAIDIMDRNLYERANDCRWWALRSHFRELLGKDEGLNEEEMRDIQAVLGHINSLYTVYDNLVLFDRHGRILAVSNPDCQSFCGKPLADEWVRQTLSLKNSQSYAVSAFEPTPLYDNRHTYIYGAAIHDLQGSGRVVGGIGIVFDSAPQFEAMLRDALPRNESGDILPGCFGVFADRQRQVIASTHPDIRPGGRLDVDDKFFSLPNGGGLSNIVELDGHYYAVGSRLSSGYREYKGPMDGYKNDVAALIFVPLCPAESVSLRAGDGGRNKWQLQVGRTSEFGETVEIATFFVDENWFGIYSEEVVEAVDLVGLTPVPGAPSYLVGYLLHNNAPVPVVDIRRLLPNRPELTDLGGKQVVLVRVREEELLGVLVDALGEIPEVARHRVEALSSMFASEGVIADSVVKPDPARAPGELLLVLNPEKICQRILAMGSLGGGAQVAGLPPVKGKVAEFRPAS
ncbi:MAG: chemotaxis protein CheW [Sulfuricellaceae bacterium]|jgi:chemotaxis signal transduction protein